MDKRKLRLSVARVRQIRLITSNILRQMGSPGPAIPIEDVARHLGAQVFYAPYEGDDLAGMLINNAGAPIIAVNSAHHKNRQRFTIAHECGHLALGHQGEAYVDKSFEVIRRDKTSSTATDQAEVEANQFAAEILMPMRFLLKDFPGVGVDFESDDRISTLAKKYGVSSQAMTYRVANLFM